MAMSSRVLDQERRGGSKWYTDWQSRDHAISFDFRHTLADRNLVCNYESFNDVRLLTERVDRQRELVLLEVGCATGDFYRYLSLKFPRILYYGLDISEPAIRRAQEKFPRGRFAVTEPDSKLLDAADNMGMPHRAEIVYAKDVVHHQTRPLEFLSELLDAAGEALILRCRTRDVGETEYDPEQSCQYHYGGWMPYIVSNLDELISHIRGQAPEAEIVVYRHRMVLGGQHNRCLPKDCYLKETGTAETAVGVFKVTATPGRVMIEDRVDQNPRYTLYFRLRRLLGPLVRAALRPRRDRRR